MSFWDSYDEAVEEESGGGGIVCQAVIETGYKVYVGGLDQVETFFPARANDKKDRRAAKVKADKLAADYNARASRWSVQIRAKRDTAVVRGQPATWQGDRFFVTNSWTEACKEVVVPSLKAAGIAQLPWEGWCRIGFKPDPYKVSLGKAGMTDTDQDGNPRFPQVAYIVEVFADETAARVAVGAVESQPGPVEAAFPEQADVPEGWDAETWHALAPDLKAARDGGQSPKAIADDYGVAVKYVVAVLKD